MLFKTHFFNKTILVTGGTGFIGSNLVHRLVSYGANVHVIVRTTSHLNRIEAVKSQINLIDVTGLSANLLTTKIIDLSPEYIFNLAQPAYKELISIDVFADQLRSTSSLLMTLLHASCTSSNLRAFVHGCSSTIYHWNEESYILSEKTILKPATERGLIKLNERNLCVFGAEVLNLPIRIARIFRAYGPRDHSYKLIIKVIECIMNNQPMSVTNDRYKRDYIYIEDLIDGLLLMAINKIENGCEVNFGSSKQYSAREIICLIESVIGKDLVKSGELKPSVYDRGEYVADISKAEELLGWKNSRSIEKGLDETIKWYFEEYGL
ncbi:NAD-dependent epimerase/dehydratase family protein [Marinoscillum pacificum]|uniref:NAD-dependent epimerase/dehydratase family protein n=1 Tax=Marinoscillum pacificum TaxID=392723 RepID=UPI00215701B6|nr:GDP-mannose 4,6-dehydratase [Marinoscillum pacificum]